MLLGRRGFSHGEMLVGRAVAEHVLLRGFHRRTLIQDCPICEAYWDMEWEIDAEGRMVEHAMSKLGA